MMSREKLNAQIDALEPKVKELWQRMNDIERDPSATLSDVWRAECDYLEIVTYFSAMVDVLIG